QAVIANTFTTGAPVGVLVEYGYGSSPYAFEFSEYSLFGDLTVHLGDRFDIQFGVRESQNRQIYNETDTGPIVDLYYGPSPYVQPTEHSKGNAFTYLVTPRFRVSPNLMIYARVATGYRLGGPNLEAALSQIPLSYDPDTTTNYEVGVKGNLSD